MDNITILTISVGVWILCGILASRMYAKLGRPSGTGFALGFFLGPIGLLIAAFKSPIQEEAVQAPASYSPTEQATTQVSAQRSGISIKMMKVISIVVALGVLGGIAWSQLSTNRDNEALNHYNDGVNHYAAGQTDLALSDYNKAIEVNPDLELAHLNRGLIYYDKAEYDLALADFNQAIKLTPNDDKAFNDRGLVYFQKKEYDLALADFDQAIQLNLNSAMSYSNRGLIYTSKNEYDLAISDLNKAITLDPSYYRAYFVRGLTYEEKMQTETSLPAIQTDKTAAIADFKKVLALSSDVDMKNTTQEQLNVLGGQ